MVLAKNLATNYRVVRLADDFQIRGKVLRFAQDDNPGAYARKILPRAPIAPHGAVGGFEIAREAGGVDENGIEDALAESVAERF